MPGLRRYQSPDEDSARWEGFPFREGDIVISTRSKHGTTWLQMICALLVFQSTEFPAPLAVLSPWLDPRHPLDAAVSLYYQGENLDRDLLTRLTGRPSRTGADRPPLDEWLARWIARDAPFDDDLDSLPGVMWHLADAWERRQDDNVVLLHYADLSTDLEGTIRSLAGRLGIATEFPQWDELVRAARFDSMKARANELAPDHLGVLRDRGFFFRAGVSGSGRAAVTADHYRDYLARAAKLAPSDLLDWLHR